LYAPLIWLGFEPRAAALASALNLLYQFWLHAEWIPRLGWLEYVLNTSSHHRLHHAANPE
jgi:sterol desaturase/sphingolipid hydroxylase (fatty acid hydroxylase superfamily)